MELEMELHYPAELPICEYRERILAAMKENQVVIVCGDTGSGKTTLAKCLNGIIVKEG